MSHLHLLCNHYIHLYANINKTLPRSSHACVQETCESPARVKEAFARLGLQDVVQPAAAPSVEDAAVEAEEEEEEEAIEPEERIEEPLSPKDATPTDADELAAQQAPAEPSLQEA